MTDLIPEWIARVERQQTHPNTKPRDAATIILLDRTSPEPKVLLGRRHHAVKFMPGKFVFPGGRVEPSDGSTAVARPLDAETEKRLMARVPRATAGRARALAVAAIRELAEETGLLLGTKQPGAVCPWQDFADTGVMPDLGALYFAARAITPPRRVKRFDTRFFVADAEAIAHRVEGLVTPDSELVELVWMPISEARTLEMVTVTKVVLGELEARLAEGLSHQQPVPFYRMLNKRIVRELL